MAWIADIPFCHQALYRALDRAQASDMNAARQLWLSPPFRAVSAEDYPANLRPSSAWQIPGQFVDRGRVELGTGEGIARAAENSVTFST
jgi:hypothetical protein